MAACRVGRSTRFGIVRAASLAAVSWALIGAWAPAGSAFTPGPEEMSCCGGSVCCGGASGSTIPCRLSYGASGTVVDARTGEPVAGARITVADLTTTSNADGSFGAFGNRPETCHLDYFVPVSVEAHGYAPFSDSLYTSVPLRHLDVRLEPLDTGTGFAINGVVAESPPCEGGADGVTVILEPLGLRTETGTAGPDYPTGYFAFTNVPPGDYTVRVEPTCNLYGCWDPRPVSVTSFDVGASLCPTLQPDTVRLSIGDVQGAPGDDLLVDATLATHGAAPARVAATISFEPEAPIKIAVDGGPACEVVAPVEAAAFSWMPAGCTAGIDCNAVQVEVQIGATPLVDGAVLFRCGVTITERPADGCYHLLRCLDLVVSDQSAGPLEAMCKHGSVESKSPVPGLGYAFSVTPEHPVVGQRVAVQVMVSGSGGLPAYTLQGAQPLLIGNTTVNRGGPVSGTVTYELDAVDSGTASLVLFVSYEAEIGCPGSTGFGFVGDQSEPFIVEIAAADLTPVPTSTPTPTLGIPCPTGTPPLCASGLTLRCAPRPGDQCNQCTCEPCPACPAGEVFTGAPNSCACTVDTAVTPGQDPETSSDSGGGCAIDRRAQSGAAGWLLGPALLAFVARRAGRRRARTPRMPPPP